jgi:hypothetical protein
MPWRGGQLGALDVELDQVEALDPVLSGPGVEVDDHDLLDLGAGCREGSGRAEEPQQGRLVGAGGVQGALEVVAQVELQAQPEPAHPDPGRRRPSARRQPGQGRPGGDPVDPLQPPRRRPARTRSTTDAARRATRTPHDPLTEGGGWGARWGRWDRAGGGRWRGWFGTGGG